MENVLPAQEMVKGYQGKNISPRCALKVELSKAFDSPNWDFLLNAVTALEFPSVFIHWIQSCVTNPMFSLSINGGSAWILETLLSP